MAEQEMREKVIKELECCVSLNYNGSKCANCDYADEFHNGDCETYLLRDALALLKAQEPVEPYTERDGRTTFFLCGSCDKPLCIAKESYKPKHCPECGRKVKWE